MSAFDIPRKPPVNVYIPWGWLSTYNSVVDLYKQANRGHKEKKCQVYGKRVNRKWAWS